jgi:DNA polymerase III delta prime subunit
MILKVLIMGLPGSGKTTLAEALAKRLGGVHWNADWVRNNLWPDLGFRPDARIQQATRMGLLAGRVAESGNNVVIDFVCPTEETREAFGRPDLLVWMNTIDAGRFEDTNKLFQPPSDADIVFTEWDDERIDEIVEKNVEYIFEYMKI